MKKNVIKLILSIIVIVLCVIFYDVLNKENIIEIAGF